MKKWNELSMAERVPYLKLGIDSGIYDTSIIAGRYNSFAKGGYTKWKEQIKKHKDIDIDNDPTYDYESFYNDNPDEAWNILKKDSDAHFTDRYKTALHPSFSQESIYSGYVNKYNPKGITGGTWVNDNYYKLSQSQIDNDWDSDRTMDYFIEAESPDTYVYAPDGSRMLRSVIVTPQLSALNKSREAHSPNVDFSYAQDMTKAQRWGANHLAGVPFLGVDPHTCLNTVTGFYNDKATVAANVNMVARPEDFGYKQISQEEAIPGDIIILSRGDNHPTHAVMFDSVADQEGTHNGYPIHIGDTLVNYSNGGRSKDSYRLQGPLPRFDDPNAAGGDFSGVHRYYRYVGKNNKKK